MFQCYIILSGRVMLCTLKNINNLSTQLANWYRGRGASYVGASNYCYSMITKYNFSQNKKIHPDHD